MQGELLADRYSLMKPLGSGGMGQVWRAWDTALGRAVAVKLLSAPADDADAARRFMDEAHAAARLTDAGIAALYDFGHATDGRPFLVMELVGGRSLVEMLHAQGQLAWEKAADLGSQAARALAAAHAGGVVHRDIKPANLLVSDDGTLKVVDFGIAQLTDHVGSGGQAARMGTAAYTSPEQALRHPTGPAADVYALGCVLYEALAGQPPFPGEDAAQVLYRHVHESPARLGEIRPDAPTQLHSCVHALLAKNPADRPHSAADVAKQLAAIAAGAQHAHATQLLPPIGDFTQHLPRIADAPDLDAPSASRRRPPQRDPRLPLAVGGLLAVGAGLLVVLFLMVGGDDGDDTTATPAVGVSTTTEPETEPEEETPSSSASSSRTASATPTATATASATPTATPSATVKPASAQNPAALSRELASALAAQSATMEPDLYREAQKDIAEIDNKLQRGETDKAAEKARDLQQRLSDGRQKGKWAGDAHVMQLVNQLAASG